jgi:hypothetical protein
VRPKAYTFFADKKEKAKEKAKENAKKRAGLKPALHLEAREN